MGEPVLNIVVPKEVAPGEARVALTPDAASRLVKAGNAVMVERAAGDAAGYRDADYEAAGA
ncbi:MAG TPA: NAD(P)(+) transhydrogenase (Re/Si-specific) subunit alpha, partial [Magnetospirillaceae bacterium]|nr:NAD(P)(+) transhydrogenase (Re/Si-specific) subunit alpha [Magnetospirillaceae bacterium]